MKLAIATPLYPPEPGGPATYAKLLEEGLPTHDVEVAAVVKFSEVRNAPKLVRHLSYFWKVYRAARKADVVIALDPVSVGFPAAWAARFARRPYVVKVVGDFAWEQGVQRFGITQDLDAFVREQRMPLPVKVMRMVQTHVAKRAARVIVPSEYLKGIVMAWGIPASHIEVIYNAINLGKGGEAPAAVLALARPRIVSVGRLVPWKGVDGLIDAISILHEPAALVIVGDGPERKALEKHAQETLGARCHFTGALSHEDTLAIMRDADVLVLNSTYEGLSHVLIEALMLGMAIVATDAGGNSELIVHEESGLLVPPGDTPALAAALERVMRNSSLKERLSHGALMRAERFTPEAMLSATAASLISV